MVRGEFCCCSERGRAGLGVGEGGVDVVVEFGEGEFEAALGEGGGHCCC